MTQSPFTKCPVLFEDAELLVVDKPDGVLSHPNPGSSGALAAFEGIYDPAERQFRTPQGLLWLIHRLDQDTSGILLATKSKKSAEACRHSFEARAVKKNYLALVSRRPMPPRGTWKDSLVERRVSGSIRAAVHSAGKPNAFLNYQLKEYFPRYNAALLEIELLSGKTHQIRVQAAYRGHPVAGDRVYGNFALNKELRQSLDLRRMFLHAWKLVLPHPVSGKPLTVESPLPEDLEQCLIRAGNAQRASHNERRSR